MATTATVPNEKAAAAPAAHKTNILVPILSSLLASGLVGGGVIFFLMHSGKLGGAQAQVVMVAAKPEPTIPVTLEPFLVNLADAGGHSYLRTTLVLKVTAPAADKKSDKKPEAKGEADPEAAQQKAEMRDTILTVLSNQSADALLAVDGKEALKKTLIDSLNKVDPELKVKEIYFTEFLVQR